MDNALNKKITSEVLKKLRGSTARERLLHRLHSVALVMRGNSAVETGKIYGDSARAVAYWVKRFRKSGIEGLREESGRGRRSTLTDEQSKRLQTFLTKMQASSETVNAKTVSDFLFKSFSVRLTERQCWRIIKKLLRE